MNRLLKILSPLFLSFWLLASCAGDSSDNGKHIGSWYNVNENQDTVELILDEENYYHLVMDGTEMLGKGIKLHGSANNVDTKYQVNYSTSPIEIDIFNIENGEEGIIGRGILKFPNEQTMLFRLASGPAKRPTSFEGDPTAVSEYKRK